MNFIGIDPGVTGALALLNPETREIQLFDTPTVQVKSGKTVKAVMDAYAVKTLLWGVSAGKDVLVTIEKVNAMPGKTSGGGRQSMGATSAFNFGMGYGMWLGIIAALNLPMQTVSPQTWKKAMMFGDSKEKDADRIRARQLYPEAADKMNLKKHHGRADALLIAAWSHKTHTVNALHYVGTSIEPF